MANATGSINFDFQSRKYSTDNMDQYAKYYVVSSLSNFEIQQSIGTILQTFQVPFSIQGTPQKMNPKNIGWILTSFLTRETTRSLKDHLEQNMDVELESNIFLSTPLPPPNPITPPTAIYDKLLELDKTGKMMDKSIDEMERFIFDRVSPDKVGAFRLLFKEYRKDNEQIQKKYEDEKAPIARVQKKLLDRELIRLKKQLEKASAAYEVAIRQTQLSIVLHR